MKNILFVALLGIFVLTSCQPKKSKAEQIIDETEEVIEKVKKSDEVRSLKKEVKKQAEKLEELLDE